MPKIFLVGMPGVGKSRWAKKWADKIKSAHYDLDNLIETLEKSSIPDIFANKGEDYFRKTEAKILRGFGEKKSFILATGGGAACFEKNMEWMNKNGITIWLDEPLDILIGRLKQGKEKRPLLKNLNNDELRAYLENKYEERKIFYGQAQHRLFAEEISNKNFEKIIHKN